MDGLTTVTSRHYFLGCTPYLWIRVKKWERYGVGRSNLAMAP